MALGLVIATITGSLIGYLLSKKSKKALNRGLYGFNTALLGILIIHNYGLSWVSVGCIIGASILSTLFMHYSIIKKIKVYTFPFVVFSWVVVTLVSTSNMMPIVNHPTADEDFLQEPTVEFIEEVLDQVGIDYDIDSHDDHLIFSAHGFG